MATDTIADSEWTATNRRIFTNHPELAGGWKPGWMCDLIREGYYAHCDTHEVWTRGEHEIPAPDLREPAVFVRVLTESAKHWICLEPDGQGGWSAWQPLRDDEGPKEERVYQGDTPHEALARALDAMEVTK